MSQESAAEGWPGRAHMASGETGRPLSGPEHVCVNTRGSVCERACVSPCERVGTCVRTCVRTCACVEDSLTAFRLTEGSSVTGTSLAYGLSWSNGRKGAVEATARRPAVLPLPSAGRSVVPLCRPSRPGEQPAPCPPQAGRPPLWQVFWAEQRGADAADWLPGSSSCGEHGSLGLAPRQLPWAPGPPENAPGPCLAWS